MSQFDGYKWIKVKQFKFDPNKSWEENYKALEKHHIEETTFLIEMVRQLDKKPTTVVEVINTGTKYSHLVVGKEYEVQQRFAVLERIEGSTGVFRDRWDNYFECDLACAKEK